MAEVRATPSTPYRVVSAFTGAGGSCLGFRMSGFECVYAIEFIEAARDTYRANFPGVHVDPRDIREIDPREILERTSLARGELDVLEGSPPCSSFSTAGKRERGWGRVNAYSDTTQRVDDLFGEYVRLLRGLMPRVFVAENVSGLVKGKAKGYFKEILADMRESGYRVRAQVLDAQWLGVPQMRARLLFVGVRDDLDATPAFPRPLAYRYSVREALPWIVQGTRLELVRETSEELEDAYGAMCPALTSEYERLKPGESSERYFSLVRPRDDRPSPTITQRGGAAAAGVAHPFEARKFTIAELKRICSFPDDFVLTGSYAQQWERLGRAVPPLMMRAIATTLRDEVLAPLDAREHVA
jgi:DNA (cytosine-5)-methyltransferase 1